MVRSAHPAAREPNAYAPFVARIVVSFVSLMLGVYADEFEP